MPSSGVDSSLWLTNDEPKSPENNDVIFHKKNEYVIIKNKFQLKCVWYTPNLLFILLCKYFAVLYLIPFW